MEQCEFYTNEDGKAFIELRALSRVARNGYDETVEFARQTTGEIQQTFLAKANIYAGFWALFDKLNREYSQQFTVTFHKIEVHELTDIEKEKGE